MKKEENVAKIVFRDYYDDLPDDEVRKVVRDVILGATAFSQNTFYYKKRKDSFTISERRCINQAFFNKGIKFVFDVS